MMPQADASERHLIRAALDETLIVEAAAGTGKTTELVQRIVNLVAEGRARVDQIVAVTFTEKAAGELKLRLRVQIEAARAAIDSDSRRCAHLEHALAHLEEAHVSTIHGFCVDLLRERPVEARVDPRFEVLSEAEAGRFHAQSFELWLQEKLEAPPEGIRRSLRRASKSGDDEGPIRRLRKAGWELVGWRDFPAPWRHQVFNREKDIDDLVEKIHAFADMTRSCSNTKDGFYQDTRQARQLSDGIRNLEKVRRRDYDGLEARMVELAQERGFAHPYHQGYDSNWRRVRRSEVRAAHAALVAALNGFARAADASLSALLHSELRESVDRYECLKQRAGRLDFVDLLVRARDLVREHDEVRAEFQRRYTHILVDEFQDTDPLQAEILLLLSSADPNVRDWRKVCPAAGKLFIVGDPKQSIYRFRRADVGTYQEVKDLLAARGARLVHLATSFRAVPAIQNLVNAAFAPVMQGDRHALQADYIDLLPYRSGAHPQPAIVALPVPRPYGTRNIALAAIEESLPDAVGAFIAWLLYESGWTVTERSSTSSRTGDKLEPAERRVQVSGRHVAILFRRFEKYIPVRMDVTRKYVDALEARGIQHLLVGGKSFHQREEIATMRAALSAIEWPDDELSIFATLRGSLFAVADGTLLEYRHRFSRLHPFRIPKEDVPEHLAPIVHALEILRSLHRRRNYVPAAETISRLLAATRAHAGFALRPSGEQALANVLHIAEMARRHEESGGISFRGFIEQLREDAESGQAGEAPILEEGSDGVRIMTVHKAKGLEFPVVILADLTANLVPSRASRYIDAERGLCALRIGGWSPADLLDNEDTELARDRAEGIRLAYVAATRARDLLVVPAIGDGPYTERWFEALNAAIYPPVGRRRSPAKAAGCPPFGDDSVLERPDFELPGPENVSPGLHRFGPDGQLAAQAESSSRERAYDVVWWDPAKLALGATPLFGLRQTELIGKEAPRQVIEAGIATYQQWKQNRDAAREQASQPKLTVCTATERVASVEEDPASDSTREVRLVDLAPDQARPGGARYGSLIHAVIAVVPLNASRAQVAQAARLQARILGATDEEVESTISAVSSALRHPLLLQAQAAWSRGRCRRETPVTLRESDGSLVEGVVDLAFEDSGAWTVVDFKTSREMERGLAIYRRQVRLYAEIISRSTGQPASPVLMRL